MYFVWSMLILSVTNVKFIFRNHESFSRSFIRNIWPNASFTSLRVEAEFEAIIISSTHISKMVISPWSCCLMYTHGSETDCKKFFDVKKLCNSWLQLRPLRFRPLRELFNLQTSLSPVSLYLINPSGCSTYSSQYIGALRYAVFTSIWCMSREKSKANCINKRINVIFAVGENVSKYSNSGTCV